MLPTHSSQKSFFAFAAENMLGTMIRRAAVNAALMARSSKPHCSARNMLTALSDSVQLVPVSYIQVWHHGGCCVFHYFQSIVINQHMAISNPMDCMLFECISCVFVMAAVFVFQREVKSIDRGAIFCASLLWRKLTIPMLRRWSYSSDGNGTAFLFPAVLATISGEILISC